MPDTIILCKKRHRCAQFKPFLYSLKGGPPADLLQDPAIKACDRLKGVQDKATGIFSHICSGKKVRVVKVILPDNIHQRLHVSV